MQPTSIPQPVFLNVEFIFSWLWGRLSWLFTIKFVAFLAFFVTILIIVGIVVIIYSLVRLYEIKKEETKKQQTQGGAGIEESTTRGVIAMSATPETVREGEIVNETWENIRSKLLSDSPSDWRLAIIEADIYLDRLLDRKGYIGDTLGDKLKNLTTGELPSLQVAWEAHKVRNRIAHEGASFTITMPEARRVLSYYEIIFRDLEAIV